MYDHTAILPVEYVEAFEHFIDSDVQVRAATRATLQRRTACHARVRLTTAPPPPPWARGRGGVRVWG